MGDATIIRAEDTAAHDRGGGVRTMYLVTRETGATAFLSGVTAFEPGASLTLHSHNCDESVVVLEGIARFDWDERSAELRPGDATLVSAGTMHRFANAGSAPLRILWTYGSVDATRTLAATGETMRIGAEPPQR